MKTEETNKCPRCNSPKPELHPAMAFEGEVQVCKHEWHQTTERGRRAIEESR